MQPLRRTARNSCNPSPPSTFNTYTARFLPHVWRCMPSVLTSREAISQEALQMLAHVWELQQLLQGDACPGKCHCTEALRSRVTLGRHQLHLPCGSHHSMLYDFGSIPVQAGTSCACLRLKLVNYKQQGVHVKRSLTCVVGLSSGSALSNELTSWVKGRLKKGGNGS